MRKELPDTPPNPKDVGNPTRTDNFTQADFINMCEKCKAKIPKNIKYRYKALSRPKTCKLCKRPSISKNFHKICRKCTELHKRCAHCGEKYDPALFICDEIERLQAETECMKRQMLNIGALFAPSVRHEFEKSVASVQLGEDVERVLEVVKRVRELKMQEEEEEKRLKGEHFMIAGVAEGDSEDDRKDQAEGGGCPKTNSDDETTESSEETEYFMNFEKDLDWKEWLEKKQEKEGEKKLDD